jgi:hypothetical protein
MSDIRELSQHFVPDPHAAPSSVDGTAALSHGAQSQGPQSQGPMR